ncbi:hypothetical protein BKA64DRAFT_175240 [Cadophora sp. MPI-SDFR-AT-0126]|nr:hypothetical protein BKA64DRAFT_175240 [Leotiomycetes sp. MPI-SDFR-AT-0126]
MDPITYPSSASSRIVSTVQITGPTDYFTYTPGTDPTQPVSPLSFETTQSTTPPKNVVSPNQTSPTQAPLPPLPQPSTLSPKSDIKTLNSALSIVRSHLSSLDAGIKRNIAAQAFAISSTCNSKKSDLPNHTISPVQVKENSRGPEFKIEDAHTSGAVLDTVKVCCVLERGLEAFIEVLGKVERDHKDELLSGANTPEMGLMDICIEKGAYVKRVMGSADEGVKSVVEFDGKKSH